MSTLLAAFAHPDDELAAAGALLAQRGRGDRIVLLWLSRGEMTGAFGDLPMEEVARRREAQGRRAGEILGAEVRFLDLPDTGIRASPEYAARVAGAIAEIRPDGMITWGRGWVRGIRHPDHQACGKLCRDAITLARMGRAVEPIPPHREPVPVFTVRDVHETLPEVAVDVEPHLDRILELARFYYEEVGFGEPDWLEARLRRTGARFGLRFAESFSAWESPPGVVTSLLPAPPLEPPHPVLSRPIR